MRNPQNSIGNYLAPIVGRPNPPVPNDNYADVSYAGQPDLHRPKPCTLDLRLSIRFYAGAEGS